MGHITPDTNTLEQTVVWNLQLNRKAVPAI